MSPLIAGNAGGAFVITALSLGVIDGNLTNLLYIRLAFACWAAPLIGILYAFSGWFSPRAPDDERGERDRQDEDVLNWGDHARGGDTPG